MAFEVCPICGHREAAVSHLQSHIMNKYKNEKGLIAVFNNDKDSIIIKGKEGAADVVWTKVKSAQQLAAQEATKASPPVQKVPVVIKEPGIVLEKPVVAGFPQKPVNVGQSIT